MAHMLEERGFATAVIAAVRAQAEKTRPPRALFTAAQLGRPLGEPGDPVFQRATLRAALALLERTDGPVILEDYPGEPPGLADNPTWTPPFPPAGDAALDGFAAELARVLPVWEDAKTRFGRTSVGLSFQAAADWPAFAARVIAGELPTVPGHGTTALAARFLCDDIKALYGEVAQAHSPAPSSNQVDAWFWYGTIAGKILLALRDAAMASDNNALKTVGGRFFVPVPWLPK